MKILEFSKNHLAKKLPFVIYKKPNENWIRGFFQKDDTLFATRNYSKSGFVFAPFDSNSPTYIFPESECDVLEEDFDNASINTLSNLSKSKDTKAKDVHLTLVSKGIEEIKSSELKKVVLSRGEENTVENFDEFLSFSKMANTYKNAFVYLWYHPKESMWLGATPETLLKFKNNQFQTIALASTQKFEGSIEVSWNDKEKEEHQFVVDFIKQQLIDSNIKDFQISSTYTVRAGNLLHLRADITGEISASEIKKLIKTLHPTPAVCGLPKKQAFDFIVENENYNREFYTGFLGEIHRENNTELFVNLRCMNVRNNRVKLFVGGGITKDSIPEKEWEETVLKTNTIYSIL